MFRRSVGAVVTRQGMFLLAERVKMLRKDGSLEAIEPEWDLVKGGIEEGESPEAAILRELLEETGSASFRIVERFAAPLRYRFPASLVEKIGFEGQETIIFRVAFDGDAADLRGDDEVGRLRFFGRAEALRLLKYPETRDWFAENVA